MAIRSLQDLLNAQEDEEAMMTPMEQLPLRSNMSEIPPAQPDMQQPVIPDSVPQEQVFDTPQLSDIIPPNQEPQVPMMADAEITPPVSEIPLSKSEQLIAEYQKMLESDQKSLEEARSSDRMLKAGGAIGDALATYLNAKGQMNVKAPGVQVQQGAGLGKIADMFATAPEIAGDVKGRREAMLKQYAELAKGERSQARLESEEKIADTADKRARELAQMQIEGNLKAAGIRGSKSEESLDFRKKEAEYNKIVRLQESFNKDKQVIKAEERMASARTMRDFLTDNNPIGAEAAKRFAARASGEVGTLTDQDVSVFGGSGAVLDRLQQAAQELATGTLTENNKKFMNQLADTFEKAGQRDLQDRLNIYAKQGTKRTKLSEDEVKETIRPDLVLQQQEQVKPSVAPKDQQALDWANKNPTDPRSIEIKKRLGM
jgi:hypothetical protein